MKTIEDFDNAIIDNLRKEYNYGENKEGFNLTTHIDKKTEHVDFDQNIINEIVLWKVNRYLKFENAIWVNDFNMLKNIDNLDENVHLISDVLRKMLNTHMIQLPMASTLLRFRNPNVFQIIDERTFRIIFGVDQQKRKLYDSTNIDKRTSLYFEYLKTLKLKCNEKKIPFHESDRLLYQFDKIENGDFSKTSKKNIKQPL